MSLSSLPHINATLNFLSSVFLIAGYIFIRQKKIVPHLSCMLSAFACSSVFLVCYLIYHFNAGRTTFRDPAWFRPYYLAILFTHTILAVVPGNTNQD